MSIHITYLSDPGIVRIGFHGTVGLAERREAVARLLAKYGHRTPLRVLVDLRYAHSVMTPEEQRQFGRFIAAHPVLAKAHIAVLYAQEQYTSLVIVSEARRHGHGIREFLLEAEAEAWLAQVKKGAPSPALV